AAAQPSQCCSNVARNEITLPLAPVGPGPYTTSLTSKLPVSVLQPRPSPYTDNPGWLVSKGQRIAPAYAPGARSCLFGAAKLRYHQWLYDGVWNATVTPFE